MLNGARRARNNTDRPTPLHRHAASIRQTIAELIEAKADASAIALLANHLELIEALIQQQNDVGVMRVEHEQRPTVWSNWGRD